MQKRQVFINALMSMVQTVIVGVVLFILYRFLLNTIGVEQLGVWSLVLATTSVTQIASFGLSGSVVKFVAKYIARGENESVAAVIETAVFSVAVFIGIVLLISYPLAKWLLGLVIPNKSLAYALAILPYSLLTLWIMSITSIFQAGLDGYQRIDTRSYLLIGGAILLLILCIILAPSYGLIGLAYAKVIQNFTVLISSWLLLKRNLPVLSVFPYKWNKNIFKEIIGYGINFQLMSVVTMSYDPITKALLSRFGGLSMVGYYEMASRMIWQFRGFVVSATQVIVPAIADLKEKIPEKIQSVYLTSYQLLFYLALPLYCLIIISAPIISELWIGHYERVFVLFAILLSIGWFLNTLNAPAYFANLGIGELHWNMIGHFTIGVLNAGLGLLLGIFYDGTGVVIAWVFSLSFGSSIIYLFYHKRHKIPLSELIPKTSRLTIMVCFTVLVSTLLIQNKLNHILNTIELHSLVILSLLIIIFISLWTHPMRKRLAGWITNELLNKTKT